MSGLKSFVARYSNTRVGLKIVSGIRRVDGKLQGLLRFADSHRAAGETTNFYERIQSKFSSRTVLHGPFKGLDYGGQMSLGSVLIPKFLGTYENELHPWLATVQSRNYDTIVDVGCAEGYYAVGLARLLPNTEVFAYDVSPEAQRACGQLALLNGVAERVAIEGFCDPKTLQSLSEKGRVLIFSDCEGYEATLFNAEVAEHLTHADLVIECHDHIGQPITKNLIALFSATHRPVIIETAPDHSKALEADLPELEGEPYAVRLHMVEERRGVSQNFLILEAFATD